MSFAPGTVLERYTVEGILGQGGMAVVYKVRHNQLGSHHALKVLSAPSPQIKERMLREGRVQGSLRHPNIVPVTDLVEISGSPGLVMEYVDGPSLEALLERYRPTLEQADALAIGILEGAAHAHRHGFVHRDLKPANVLLANTPNGLSPKVTDFGLAKLVGGDETPDLHHTRSGMIMGTPSYMAPEQIRDSKHVDQRADVFSLGVMLYELISGRKPFTGQDIVQLYTAITAGKYRPIHDIVPNIPDRMERAIGGALVVDRNARIQDCDRLLAIWKGDQSSRRSSTDAERRAARAQAPTMVPDLPEPFFPEASGDANREITFHDSGSGLPPPVTTRDHPLLFDPTSLRFAAPSIGEIDPTSDVPLADRAAAPSPNAPGALGSIDPSGGQEDALPEFGARFSVGTAVAVVLVAITVLGGGLLYAMGDSSWSNQPAIAPTTAHEASTPAVPASTATDPSPSKPALPPDRPAPPPILTHPKPSAGSPATPEPAASALPKPVVGAPRVDFVPAVVPVDDVSIAPPAAPAPADSDPPPEPVRTIIVSPDPVPPVDTPTPDR